EAAAPLRRGEASLLPAAEPEVFGERLSRQLSVMVNNHTQQARLAVSPAELGPVEVRVSVSGDEAQVQLAAAHAATRELLEDAMPRLRAALSESGLALTDADVFSAMPQERGDGDGLAAEDGRPAGDPEAAPAETAEGVSVRVSTGLIDAFV
ncbi:MAG: flagellar hook-length control protein FliK, partial [Gammaproteobacteria bacterium]